MTVPYSDNYLSLIPFTGSIISMYLRVGNIQSCAEDGRGIVVSQSYFLVSWKGLEASTFCSIGMISQRNLVCAFVIVTF